jgi:cytochrome d ubiquinol oxidase subunit I
MWRGRLYETRWYLRIVSQTWWVGFVAVISGWVVSESGRQPWIVQGILRTADAVSPVPGASVLTTLILFILVYGVVFSFGIYFINRLIARGPQEVAGEHAKPSQPVLASGRAADSRGPS